MHHALGSGNWNGRLLAQLFDVSTDRQRSPRVDAQNIYTRIWGGRPGLRCSLSARLAVWMPRCFSSFLGSPGDVTLIVPPPRKITAAHMHMPTIPHTPNKKESHARISQALARVWLQMHSSSLHRWHKTL